MGFALPAAIGAKFARPDAEVWAVVGDGGFQMTSCELATIVQEKINIKIAIINNGYLAWSASGRNFSTTSVTWPRRWWRPILFRWRTLSASRGERITSRAEVVSTIESARHTEQPVLLDFRVEQEDSVYPMVAAGAALHDMIRRPNSPLVESATEP